MSHHVWCTALSFSAELEKRIGSRRFAAHANRVHAVGASLSPCLRYVMAGSEDRCAYLYDAQSGGLIERLRHTDVVTDVAFSPLHPQCACAGLDGRLRFFCDTPEPLPVS